MGGSPEAQGRAGARAKLVLQWGRAEVPALAGLLGFPKWRTAARCQQQTHLLRFLLQDGRPSTLSGLLV